MVSVVAEMALLDYVYKYNLCTCNGNYCISFAYKNNNNYS